MPLEGDIERNTRDAAAEEGWLSFKLNLTGNRGWPDVLFITAGPTFVFIEFKQPGEKPRKLQYHYIEALRALRVNAHWVDTQKQAMEILRMAKYDRPHLKMPKTYVVKIDHTIPPEERDNYYQHCQECGQYTSMDRWTKKGSGEEPICKACEEL